MQSILGKRKKTEKRVIPKTSIYSFPKSVERIREVLTIPRGEWNWLENTDCSCYAIVILESVVRIDKIVEECKDRNNYFHNFLHYTKHRLSTYYNVYKVPRCLNAERLTNRLYKKLNYPKFIQRRLFINDGGWYNLLFQRLRKKLNLVVPTNLYENEWKNRIPFLYKQPDIFSFNVYRKHTLSLPSIRMRKEMKFELKKDCSLQHIVKKYVLLNFPKVLVIETNATGRTRFCLDVPEILVLKKKKFDVDKFEYEKTTYLARRQKQHIRIPNIEDEAFSRRENAESSEEEKNNICVETRFSLQAMILYEFVMKIPHAVAYVKEKENEWRKIDSASSNQQPVAPYNPEYGKRNATLMIYTRT